MAGSKAPRPWLVYFCTFAGAALGTFGFFGIAFLSWPNPLSNALRASIATLGRNTEPIIQIAEVRRISELIQSGYLVTTNELLTSVANYYGTLVAVLIALIALLAAGAYLTIRGGSISHIENIVSDKVKDGGDHYFSSVTFNELVINSVEKMKNISDEERQNEIEELREAIEEIRQWRDTLRTTGESGFELTAEEPDIPEAP